MAWAVSMPIDAIKSVIQTHSHPESFVRTAASLLRSRGVRGLYNGVEVAIVRAFPANAALFVGYEYSRKLIS